MSPEWIGAYLNGVAALLWVALFASTDDAGWLWGLIVAVPAGLFWAFLARRQETRR